MRTALKTLLFLVLSFGFTPSHAAQLCAPQALKEGQKTQAELAYENFTSYVDRTFELAETHFRKTDEIPSLRQKIKALQIETLQQKKLLENFLPQWPAKLSHEAIQYYLLAVAQLGAVEVQVLGFSSKLENPQLLEMDSLEFLHINPSVIVAIPGVSAQMQGDKTWIGINAATRYSSHLTGTSSIQGLKRDKQYFETVQCLMGKLLIEKASSYAGLAHQRPQLDLSKYSICNGLPMQDLLDATDNSLTDELYEKSRGFFAQTKGSISKEDMSFFEEVAGKYVYPSLLPLITDAALDAHKNRPELKDVNEIILGIENSILTENALFNDLLQAGLSAQGAIESELTTCNGKNAQLKNFAQLFQRSLVAEFGLVFPLLTSFDHAADERWAAKNLEKNLVAILAQIAESAYGSELLVEGEEDAKALLHTFSAVRAKLHSSIEKSLKGSGVAEKIWLAVQKKKIENRPGLLEKYPALVDFSIAVKGIFSKDTKREDLPFEPRAMGKLFSADINNLPHPFNYHLGQIISRNTHEDRRSTWLRTKEFLKKDQADYGYECVETSLLADLQNGLIHGFFGGKAPKNYSRQNACHTVLRVARHYGIESAEAPESLADVWPSFESEDFYDGGDRKLYEKNYRKYLSATLLDTYRMLDITLDKIQKGGDDETYVYDFIASEGAATPAAEEVIQKALLFSRSQLEIDLLTVANAKSIEDLHPYIGSTLLLDNLLDARGYSHYVPGAMARNIDPNAKMGHPLFPSLYQHHVSYRRNLNRTEHLEKSLNTVLISKMNLPILFLGGAWVTKAILSKLPVVHVLGTAMNTAAQSSRLAINGYMSFLTYVFASAAVNANATRIDLNHQINKVGQMKFSDAMIIGDDIPIISYDSYLTKTHSLKLDRTDAKWDMAIYGGFTAFSVIMSSVGPIMASRAATRSLSGAEPWRITKWAKTNAFAKRWAAHQAKMDRRRLSWAMKHLGNPRSFDLSTLQAARTTATSKHAEEAYHRLIFHLGQRANGSIGFASREQALAKEYFGSSSNVQGLHEISAEYARLFPDVVRGF